MTWATASAATSWSRLALKEDLTVKLSVLHETRYKYTWPVVYSIQHVRLYPREEAHQSVLQWKVDSPTRSTVSNDTFQNRVHTFTVNASHQDLCVKAKGIIEINPLHDGILLGEHQLISPHTFTVATPLTASGDPIRTLAEQAMAKPGSFHEKIMRLANAVADRVNYRKGTTTVRSTAIEALEQGCGVCQDHAHVMLACLRSLGMPGRYVSGYYFAGFASQFASHAWVDVFDPYLQQWISIDPTHRCFASDQHCRLAIGRDYETAAPIRGVRSGGGKESLSVNVQLETLELA